jgi:hypothetical protein
MFVQRLEALEVEISAAMAGIYCALLEVDRYDNNHSNRLLRIDQYHIKYY